MSVQRANATALAGLAEPTPELALGGHGIVTLGTLKSSRLTDRLAAQGFCLVNQQVGGRFRCCRRACRLLMTALGITFEHWLLDGARSIREQ